MTSSRELDFPTDLDDFDQDDRISFSRLDDRYIAVDDDGSEYKFDPLTRSWLPLDPDEDEDEDDDGQDADVRRFRPASPAMADPLAPSSSSRKRKGDALLTAENNGHGDARGAKKSRPPPGPKPNRAVYVTGLPPDATVEEVHELFLKKGGLIAEDFETGQPRIKFYQDDHGRFKGDALVVFFKPQSVDIATMLLDDTPFRVSATGLGSGRIRVQAANTNHKQTHGPTTAPIVAATNTTAEGAVAAAEADTAAGVAVSARPARSDKERQKIKHKLQKMDAKLADWDEDDDRFPQQPSGADKASRWDKMVILRHMFTTQELDDDPAALLDIKEDVRNECSKLGDVTNVVLFDMEPDGVVSVKFRTKAAAEACVVQMHGRAFGGQVVEASIATGRERFKKSKQKQDDDDEAD